MFQVKIMKVVRSLEQFFFSSFLMKASVQGKELNPHVDVVVSAPSGGHLLRYVGNLRTVSLVT